MKTKKTRTNKKRNHLKTLGPALQNVALYSAHCFTDMQQVGVKNHSIVRALFNMEHKWQVMLFAFCEHNGERYADTKLVPFSEAVKSRVVQDTVDPMSLELGKQQNPKHIVSSGWYCVPSDKIDLASMKDSLVEMFGLAGAFDREVCQLAWSMRGADQ